MFCWGIFKLSLGDIYAEYPSQHSADFNLFFDFVKKIDFIPTFSHVWCSAVLENRKMHLLLRGVLTERSSVTKIVGEGG